MEEFSEVSGISRPTISKYFNDPSSVRSSTRDRIEQAIKKYDYRPNLFAINQNRKLTRNIGIVVPHIVDPFFAEIVRHIETRCIEAGYWAIVLSSHGQAELEANALDMLRSLKVAGAIIAPLGQASDEELIHQFASEVPTVLCDSRLDGVGVFVGTDNFQTIDLIVDYLSRAGDPPCFVEMPPVNANAYERKDAYVRSMERLGLDPKIIPIVGEGWDFERLGYEQGLRLIASRELPSNTILCANDRIAIGMLAAAYEKGLRVGRGPGSAIRIAGHDDHPLSRFTCPPLTTVSQDYTAIADRSLHILFDAIEHNDAHIPSSQVRLEGKLIMRISA
ncbi:LacI family DNA-binding transcriptional regulator [Rhizobium aquaticum]|uniref:LacI family DNA-binding transcriptional regulator n=1 Tax=Rhizobium aquaticum TaxID=1549636 RepID=UPI003397AC7D